jgi:hypothetical protein
MKSNNNKSGFERNQQPPYQIGDLDLSTLWLDLIRKDKVSATVSVPSVPSSSFHGMVDNEQVETTTISSISVRYGIRMIQDESSSSSNVNCEEYVEEVGLQVGELSQNPMIRSINETLVRIQQRQQQQHEEHDVLSLSGVYFKQAGGFIAQVSYIVNVANETTIVVQAVLSHFITLCLLFFLYVAPAGTNPTASTFAWICRGHHGHSTNLQS